VTQFFITIAPHFWLACFAILLVGLFTKADKSAFIALTVWIVTGLLMDKIAPEIKAITDKRLARHLWYLTFVVINFASIGIILLTHRRFRLKASTLTLFISTTYVGFVVVHGLRFVDRMVLKTDMLETFYRYTIPTLNIAVILMALLWLSGRFERSNSNKRI
jgi:hypothetical protein